MRELTDKPFGVNIAQAFVRDPAIVDFVIDQGVKFVTTSAATRAVHRAAQGGG
jgi:enoyl-[acyl-carrier protein] reductase II